MSEQPSLFKNMPTTGYSPIDIARTATMEQAKQPEGCVCPVCGQLAKVYTRPMNGQMVEMLIKLHIKHGENVYFHAPSQAIKLGYTNTGDFAKLRYWGMIQEKPHPSGLDGKSHSGWWKITHAGQLFIQNKIFVPKYVVLYNQKKIDMNGDRVNVVSALGEKFDYNKLFEKK